MAQPWFNPNAVLSAYFINTAIAGGASQAFPFPGTDRKPFDRFIIGFQALNLTNAGTSPIGLADSHGTVMVVQLQPNTTGVPIPLMLTNPILVRTSTSELVAKNLGVVADNFSAWVLFADVPPGTLDAYPITLGPG